MNMPSATRHEIPYALAKQRAERLRSEAIASFYRQIGAALANGSSRLIAAARLRATTVAWRARPCE